MVAHALLDGEAGVEIRLAHIVEEDAARPARLVAMLEEEILVAPLLEFRMQRGIERRQRVLADLVEVLHVFLETVIRCEVHAAAEPEHLAAVRLVRHEHAHVACEVGA